VLADPSTAYPKTVAAIDELGPEEKVQYMCFLWNGVIAGHEDFLKLYCYQEQPKFLVLHLFCCGRSGSAMRAIAKFWLASLSVSRTRDSCFRSRGAKMTSGTAASWSPTRPKKSLPTFGSIGTSTTQLCCRTLWLFRLTVNTQGWMTRFVLEGSVEFLRNALGAGSFTVAPPQGDHSPRKGPSAARTLECCNLFSPGSLCS